MHPHLPSPVDLLRDVSSRAEVAGSVRGQVSGVLELAGPRVAACRVRLVRSGLTSSLVPLRTVGGPSDVLLSLCCHRRRRDEGRRASGTCPSSECSLHRTSLPPFKAGRETNRSLTLTSSLGLTAPSFSRRAALLLPPSADLLRDVSTWGGTAKQAMPLPARRSRLSVAPG